MTRAFVDSVVEKILVFAMDISKTKQGEDVKLLYERYFYSKIGDFSDDTGILTMTNGMLVLGKWYPLLKSSGLT